VAPPKFREETSKKAVRLGAVCRTDNGPGNRGMQGFFAAMQHFLFRAAFSACSGGANVAQAKRINKKTAVLVAPPKLREETSKKAVRLSAVCKKDNGGSAVGRQALFCCDAQSFRTSSVVWPRGNRHIGGSCNRKLRQPLAYYVLSGREPGSTTFTMLNRQDFPLHARREGATRFTPLSPGRMHA